MEQDKKYTCLSCKGLFTQWNYEYNCQHCDDGIAETSRDIDFNGTGYCKCSVCKGTGIESQVETDFCCEDCISEHSWNS